jgi:ATP-binding protein involved in chromosome partitioning
MDADIYGPSQPWAFRSACYGRRAFHDADEQLWFAGDVIGFLIASDDTPMIWRGPMVTQALDQLLRQTLGYWTI